jgi:hypothetical protein
LVTRAWMARPNSRAHTLQYRGEIFSLPLYIPWVFSTRFEAFDLPAVHSPGILFSCRRFIYSGLRIVWPLLVGPMISPHSFYGLEMGAIEVAPLHSMRQICGKQGGIGTTVMNSNVYTLYWSVVFNTTAVCTSVTKARSSLVLISLVLPVPDLNQQNSRPPVTTSAESYRRA